MLNVLLTIHMIACVALVIAVMLQRSEGGALGMGGGGTGGLISGRGAAGVLVKTTMGLAFVFFVTSITMTRLNNDTANQGSILEQQVDETVNPFDTLSTTPAAPGATTTTPDPLGATPSTTTPAPATTTPATPAPAPARDPLAPATNTAPATTPPATTAPTQPAPTPENGGSPN
jgi:preprotein translocase subunit SecG